MVKVTNRAFGLFKFVQSSATDRRAVPLKKNKRNKYLSSLKKINKIRSNLWSAINVSICHIILRSLISKSMKRERDSEGLKTLFEGKREKT